jgi:GNAT superfamily N-acetyltransferase
MFDFFYDDYLISADNKKLDAEAVHSFLTNSYWAKGRSLEIVKKTLNKSLCFGVYFSEKQIGLARIITDYTTFAHLCDVYILEEYRGKNLGKRLIQTVLEYPALSGIKRWSLCTDDAHGLYKKFNFTSLANPDQWMERIKSDKF